MEKVKAIIFIPPRLYKNNLADANIGGVGVSDTEWASSDDFYIAHVFNGCYAFLMFVVVIFFLIYGVEVFFKVSHNIHSRFTTKVERRICRVSCSIFWPLGFITLL